MNIEDILTTAYRTIQPSVTPFREDLFGVFTVDDDLVPRLMAEDSDIYRALLSVASTADSPFGPSMHSPLRHARGIGVIVTGWATPLNPLGGVDEMKGRRRARIAVLTTENLATGALVGFEDEPQRLVFDDGGAYGELIDAVLDTMRSILGFRIRNL